MNKLLHFQSRGVPVRLYAEEIPPSSQPEKLHPAILFLHGAGGHVDFWVERLSPLLREADVALYAPHYFDRTKTTRADLGTITDGVHVPQWLETVTASLDYITDRPGVEPNRIVLAGVSLGGFLALALAAQLSQPGSSSPRPCALVEISGGLAPPYDTLATAHMPPTLILHGEEDRVVPVSWAHALNRRLSELNVPHRRAILPNEGHWFSVAALPHMLLAVSSFLPPLLRPAQ